MEGMFNPHVPGGRDEAAGDGRTQLGDPGPLPACSVGSRSPACDTVNGSWMSLSEPTFRGLGVTEDARMFQTRSRCSGILSRVCLLSVLLFISLGLLLFQSIILVQVSRIHDFLQSQPGMLQENQTLEEATCIKEVAAPQKQIQGDLKVINQCLARMNVTMGTLCRQCPWDWEFFQGSCYWFSKSQSNWKTSESACQSMNSHLVIVNSVSEEKFLQTWEVRHGQRTWIGLSDLRVEGSWQWVDGTPLELSFWKPGEPNNDGDEDCVELYNDGWNDDKCGKEKIWICERAAVSCSNL